MKQPDLSELEFAILLFVVGGGMLYSALRGGVCAAWMAIFCGDAVFRAVQDFKRKRGAKYHLDFKGLNISIG
jgi:hypothetical protein